MEYDKARGAQHVQVASLLRWNGFPRARIPRDDKIWLCPLPIISQFLTTVKTTGCLFFGFSLLCWTGVASTGMDRNRLATLNYFERSACGACCRDCYEAASGFRVVGPTTMNFFRVFLLLAFRGWHVAGTGVLRPLLGFRSSGQQR